MVRLYVPPESWLSAEFALPDAEARHAVQVMRLEVGGRVELFDGVGRVAHAELIETSKRGARVRVLEERRVERAQPAVHLILALIKGERFDWAVQKATELGAASISPVMAERSVVKLAGKDLEKRRQKWIQTAVEAAKQCEHDILPEIFLPRSSKEAFRQAPEGRRGIPTLGAAKQGLESFLVAGQGDVTFAIGPEGDWTEEELETAKDAGFEFLNLGNLVLRSETAALYVLSVAAHRCLGGVGGINEEKL